MAKKDVIPYGEYNKETKNKIKRALKSFEHVGTVQEAEQFQHVQSKTLQTDIE